MFYARLKQCWHGKGLSNIQNRWDWFNDSNEFQSLVKGSIFYIWINFLVVPGGALRSVDIKQLISPLFNSINRFHLSCSTCGIIRLKCLISSHTLHILEPLREAVTVVWFGIKHIKLAWKVSAHPEEFLCLEKRRETGISLIYDLSSSNCWLLSAKHFVCLNVVNVVFVC